jgi:dihydroorotate dehydrogenase
VEKAVHFDRYMVKFMQIISNTTISRPLPVDQNPVSKEVGGLSGKPLFDMSTKILKEMYLLTRVISKYRI